MTTAGQLDLEAPAPPAVRGIDAVDLASIDPCPLCADPVRRFANTPLYGTGNDARPCGPWFCVACSRSGRALAAQLGILAALMAWMTGECEPPGREG